MALKTLLLVPTNPEYSFDDDPSEQASYVNPVTLNNLIVKYANAAVDVTDKLIGLKKTKVELDLKYRTLKQDIEDLEYDILQEFRGSTNDHKTLKSQAAFVRKMAKESGRYETLQATEVELRKVEAERLRRQVDIENAASTLAVIDQLSSNVTTHLSYVKNEMRHTRSYS